MTNVRTRVPVWAGSALLMVVLAVPVVWVTLSRHYVNSSDWASIELRTRDVFSTDPPLVGAYSRLGWSHPGPLPFYLLAVPYRLFGQDAQAMQLGAILLNLAVIALTLWLLARRGSAALVVGGLAIAATVWGLPADSLGDSWNATLAVLPFLLTLVACWSSACGDRAGPVVAAVAYALAFQAHVGFGLVAAPVVVATLVYVLVDRDLRHRLSRPLAWAAGLSVLLAVPLAVDAARDWPGNLGDLVRWSVEDEGPKGGLHWGLRIIGRGTSVTALHQPRLPFFLDELVQPMPIGFLPGTLLALLVAALAVAARRRWREELLLAVGLLLTWAVGLLAAANVSGPQYEWLYNWLDPLAWLSWATVVLVGWRLLAERFDRRRVATIGLSAAGVVLAVLLVDHGRRAVDGEYVWTELVDPVDRLADAAADAVDPSAPTLLTADGDVYLSQGVLAGLVNELDQRGHDVAVDPAAARQFGQHRVVDDRVGTHLVVRAERTPEPPPPGGTEVAVVDDAPPDVRAEMDRLTADLAALLESVSRADQVSLLTTSVANWVLLDDPDPAVVARAADIERLAAMRAETPPRYVLYSLPVAG